jgi:hypothetical protein
MKTVRLEVASRKDVTRRALDAFKGKKQRAGITLRRPNCSGKSHGQAARATSVGLTLPHPLSLNA